MKCLLMLISLTLVACTNLIETWTGQYSKPTSIDLPHNHDIFAIDSTVKQIDYEYNIASHAISVNDAEKVYLQRFKEDLLDKRHKICDKEVQQNGHPKYESCL
jgi:hypothetical protein